MVIVVKKNDVVIKEYECEEHNMQSTFDKAHDYAGGKWNGVDKFTVSVK